jgi:hypothetical protein
MNLAHAWWRLSEAAAAYLPARERDAVLGDLEESGITGVAALRDVLGLVMRRFAVRWHSWRPWLAGFGLALPTALLTMGASLALSRDAVALHDAPLATPTALTLIALRTMTLALWAWTCGRSVGALSRETLGTSTVLTILPCLFCLSRYHDAALPFTSLLLLLPLVLAGARTGQRRTTHPMASSVGTASAVTLGVMLLGGVSIWWTWPAWYLVFSAHRAKLSAPA